MRGSAYMSAARAAAIARRYSPAIISRYPPPMSASAIFTRQRTRARI